MEQRLTLVYKSVKPQYAVDSCLLLEACALYFDNVDMQFVAQLKLKNIGTEKINAVIVELLCFNSFGYEVQKCSYQYDRLSVGKGQIFGVKNAIPLGKEKINKYAVCIKAIAFENGTVKEVDTAIRYSHLPESKELRLEGDLREQYKRDLVKLGFKTTVSYQPQRADGLWQCVCGSWQKDNDLCITCQSEYKALVDALSRGLVENHLSEHNETERKNRIYSEAQNKTSSVWSSEKDLLEAVSMLASIRGWRNANELMLECEQRLQDIKEQKQIEEEHMQQRKRRKKTWSLITFVVIGLLVIIGIAVVPDQKYNAAVSMMHHGEYEKAIATFNEIKTYRDSAEKIKLCKNNQNFLNNFSVMPGMYVWDTQKDAKYNLNRIGKNVAK